MLAERSRMGVERVSQRLVLISHFPQSDAVRHSLEPRSGHRRRQLDRYQVLLCDSNNKRWYSDAVALIRNESCVCR